MQVQRDIALFYEDVNITDDVDIMECVVRDVSCGESDCLSLTLDHADRWFRWNPQKNDRLRVTRSGYDSKTLYLNTIMPRDGTYRVLATAQKSVPHPPGSKSYENQTLDSIMRLCAGECGMGARLFGVSGGTRYEYLLRDRMSAPAFMAWLAEMEGAVLKALDGNYTLIGIAYAQNLPAMHEMELNDGQMDSDYTDMKAQRWAGCSVKTPFGSGLARHSGVTGTIPEYRELPVENDAMACRWARGMLLSHNRLCETLSVSMDFNPGYTAMARVDVKSKTDAAGQWMIHETEQDLVNGRTRAKMVRCLSGIG